MAGWITPQEALVRDPKFFRKRGKNAWKMDAKNRRIHSRFGFAEVRVQTKPDGTPDFDRVVYGEAPNINAVVWGIDSDGVYRVAVVIQLRPFADHPAGWNESVTFGQPCVMGFLDRIVGRKLAEVFESSLTGATREALEEAGAREILSIKEMGGHNPNPTFCATWSELLDIQVDLAKVEERTDKDELIYKAEYMPVKKVLDLIGRGGLLPADGGVSYRSATANDAFLVWLSRHPEALAQAAS